MTDGALPPRSADGESLAPDLRRAVALLREVPEPPAAWRARVVAAATHGRRSGRVVSLRRAVWFALAAGVAGVVAGGAMMRAAMPRGAAPAPPRAAGVAGAATVRFTLVAPQAARVAVVGDFNHWDPARTPMRRAADGSSWEITVPLAPGRYEYSFLVDGVLATDPSAPRAPDADFGAPNSIVFVRGS